MKGKALELVYDGDSALRLDQALAALASELSRGAARRLIDAGSVFLNGQRCRVASRTVRRGDRLRVAVDALPPDAERVLDVLYEDDSLIAINKPADLPSAPTPEMASGSAIDLTQRWLRRRDGNAVQLRLVHRLDAPTSGVLVFAKTRPAASRVASAFSARTVRKRYVARVDGEVHPDEGEITFAVRRAGGRSVLDENGKSACTRWRVLVRADHRTTVELVPETGRMHQLRIHLKALGHPVVGDRLYGGPAAARLMLHAQVLEIPCEDGTTLTIEAPLPPELR